MEINCRDVQILRHIAKYCHEIDETIDRFGRNQERFMQDFIYKNAVSMPVFQMAN